MAKKYLKGSDVESDPNRVRARLGGIAHELYLQKVYDAGVDYVLDEYVTMYGAVRKQKKQDSGDLEADGSIKWNRFNEWVLEFDEESEDYAGLITIHKNKAKDKIDLENEGWDLT